MAFLSPALSEAVQGLAVSRKSLWEAIGREGLTPASLQPSEWLQSVGLPGLMQRETRMCQEEPRCSVREYRFLGEEEEAGSQQQPELVVLIPEVLDPQYGMYVWPCAVVLAQYIWFHRRLICGKNVLEPWLVEPVDAEPMDMEGQMLLRIGYTFYRNDVHHFLKKVNEDSAKLGAGVSLPGIVAAKCGAKTTLSDNAEFPQCLDNCRRSCQMNNLSSVSVTGITWGHISPSLLALSPVDIILASDVFFEPEDFEDILSTVHYLMRKNPYAQFWTTYQVRSTDWSIEGLLYKWEMESICVPLQSFEANKEQLVGSFLPGTHTVEMMVITLKKEIL